MIYSLLFATLAYLGRSQSTEVCKKCCEGLFKTGEGKGSWEFTNTNGAGWSADENSIRYDFINDSRCGGTVNFRQFGTATFSYTSEADTTVTFEMEGIAESSYERFEFFVDGTRIVRIQASNTNTCKVSTCNMCEVNMDPQKFTFTGGETHTIQIRADSLDGYYHNDCYFAIKFTIDQGDECDGCPSCTTVPTAAPVTPTSRPTDFDPCLTKYTNKALNVNDKNTFSAERIACHNDEECKWYTMGGKNIKRDGELKKVQGVCVKRDLCQNLPNKKECLSRKDCYVHNNKEVRGWGDCRSIPNDVTCDDVDQKDLCRKSPACYYSTKDTQNFKKKKCYDKPQINACSDIEKRRACVRHDTLKCDWQKPKNGKKGVCVGMTCEDINVRPEERDEGHSCKFAGQQLGLTCYDYLAKAFLKEEGLGGDGQVCVSTKPCGEITTKNACQATDNFSGESKCVWNNRYVRHPTNRQQSTVEDGCLELDCTTIESKNVCNQLNCFWKRAGKRDTEPSKCVFPTKSQD